MAIYSLNHSAIGRSTHLPGTSAAHARYIMRDGAMTDHAERLPGNIEPNKSSVARWLSEEERSDRANARVIDKVRVALPKELSPEQQRDLVKGFCEDMTQGRTPYLAAVHAGPKDADNPHAHIIIRDRDMESGKRFLKTTERDSTERFREKWEEHANRALERAGREERIDHRSLKDQGIVDREPTRHEGPNVRAMEEKGIRTELGEHNRAVQQRNSNVVDFQKAKAELLELKRGQELGEKQAHRAQSGLWDKRGLEAVERIERERGAPLTQKGAERRLEFYEGRERRLEDKVAARSAATEMAKARWNLVRKPARDYDYWSKACERHRSLSNVPALILSKRARNQAAYAAGRQAEAARNYRAACKAAGVPSAEEARHRFYSERKNLRFETERLERTRTEAGKAREAWGGFQRAEEARWTRRTEERANGGYWDRKGSEAVTRVERERGRAVTYDNVRDGHLGAMKERDQAKHALAQNGRQAEDLKEYRGKVEQAVAEWQRCKAETGKRDGWIGSAAQLVSKHKAGEARAARDRQESAYRRFDGLMKERGFKDHADYQARFPGQEKANQEQGAELSRRLTAAEERARLYKEAEAGFRRQAEARMERDPDLKARHEERMRTRLYTPQNAKDLMKQEALREGTVKPETLRHRAEQEGVAGSARELGGSLGAERKARELGAYREGRNAGTSPRDKEKDEQLRGIWKAIKEDRDPAFKELLERLEGRQKDHGERIRERIIRLPDRGGRG